MRISDVKLLSDRKYDLVGSIGHGAYSKVKLFHSTHLNRNVSIKIINKALAPRDFVQNFLPREIEVLQLVRHPNIVDIYEILATNDGRIFIISEYARHGDLLHHIQRTGPLTETHSQVLFSQLNSAIDYLHKKFIVHRDLKCENLLLTSTVAPLEPKNSNPNAGVGNNTSTSKSPRSSAKHVDTDNLKSNFDLNIVKIVLADFGFSRKYSHDDEKSRTFCGSAAYAAPEIIKGEPYMLRNHDMWSLGVILFIMVCGTMPFDDSNIRQMLKDQMSRRIRFPPQILYKLSAECKELIHKLIEPNTQTRYSVDEVAKHNWISPPQQPTTHRDRRTWW